MRSNHPKDMLIGSIHYTKFNGSLVVIDYKTASSILIRFNDTGYECFTTAAKIRDGYVKDYMRRSVFGVGFVGDGPYKTRAGGRNTLQYNRWVGIMERCYSEKYQRKNPTYIGCSVCSEWHDFQKFAKWFDENYPADGGAYHIDKDIKIDGNRVYSPDACIFATIKENNQKAQSKTYRVICPDGNVLTVVNMAKFCRDNKLNHNGMSLVARGVWSQHLGYRVFYV